MGEIVEQRYDDCAERVKRLLTDSGLQVREEQDNGENYQFRVFFDDESLGYIRFYQRGDGNTTVDFSQLKAGDATVANALDGYIDFPETDSSVLDELPRHSIVGTDESGKGDFFGPLVIAAVHIPDDETAGELEHLGVADSKRVSDSKVFDQSQKIRQLCDVAVVDLPPATYNRLYDDIGNLNRLMGWAHARAIEDLLEDDVLPDAVVSDKFGDESYINDKLMEKGQGIDVIQETKAEQHLAVAAASVIARNAFLQKLVSLSTEYDVDLPKGAGKDVVEAGEEFVEKHGAEQLGEVAKLHFKTRDKIL